MQETNFPYEIIIGEDCSTDNTKVEIDKLVKQFPELVRVITSENNVGVVENEFRVLVQAKSKYIAFCEGDDYWTDPYKLQRQVDFLETHPDYAVCFHRCRHHYTEENRWEEDNCGKFFELGQNEGIDITTDMFFREWITQPLSMVFRRESLDLSIALKYKYYRDTHQIYHLLQAGKGYLFKFIGGIRLIHQNGMYSMTSLASRCEIAVNIAKELFSINKNRFTKQYYTDILQWSINENSGALNNPYKAISLSFRLFFISFNFIKLGKNFKRTIYSRCHRKLRFC